MWDVFARLRLVALGLGVLAAGSVVEASVLSFKAIKKNDVTITPGVCNMATFKCTTGPVGNTCANNNDCPIGTNNLSVVANDKIEVNLFLSAWANDFPKYCLGGPTPGITCAIDANCGLNGTCNKNVRLFQVKLNRTGYVSNDNGTAKPLGWCGPVDRISCTTPASPSAECNATNPAYPNCLTPAGCTCSPHNPDLGGFITTSRTDFLLFGLDGPLPECVTSFIGYTYYGLAESDSVPDTGVSRYLGTLILTVSANACGTFTIGSIQDIAFTFIADPATMPNVRLPSLQPLVLTVSNCSRQLLSCSPGHCNIDARIAHDRLDQNLKKNANQMVMTFNKSTTSPNMTAADFEVTINPYDPINDIIPTIALVTPNPGNSNITTLTFNRRIQQTRWTCIREKGSNKRCCMGSLPADASTRLDIIPPDSPISQPDDVFEVINNLNGCLDPPGCTEPLLPIERCDTDRSVQCSPADLLMVVDLLNGADAFDPVWNPVTGGNMLPALVPACMTMNMPP